MNYLNLLVYWILYLGFSFIAYFITSTIFHTNDPLIAFLLCMILTFLLFTNLGKDITEKFKD
ncbi:hypothetical protein [Mangrovibacillus cuniculi]|uniref:Uncharacterized protein n=1 Tax=Mangrovibacillus cuniculi TaxID=2593652 RepID=A0A7S8HEJ5_9BACI|nr:hypothetical protein [Mangrovibacillus cuniculi]QPC45904.1 hypothetical protein G8O30_02500 [Mangrovibacillus cuniculi]